MSVRKKGPRRRACRVDFDAIEAAGERWPIEHEVEYGSQMVVDVCQGDVEVFRSAWEWYQERGLLTEFIRKHPGRRPFAWWLFDMPRDNPRRQLVDVSPMFEANARLWGIIHHIEGHPPIFEPQGEYLLRIGAMDAAERVGWEQREAEAAEFQACNRRRTP